MYLIAGGMNCTCAYVDIHKYLHELLGYLYAGIWRGTGSILYKSFVQFIAEWNVCERSKYFACFMKNLYMKENDVDLYRFWTRYTHKYIWHATLDILLGRVFQYKFWRPVKLIEIVFIDICIFYQIMF